MVINQDETMNDLSDVGHWYAGGLTELEEQQRRLGLVMMVLPCLATSLDLVTIPRTNNPNCGGFSPFFTCKLLVTIMTHRTMMAVNH